MNEVRPISLTQPPVELSPLDGAFAEFISRAGGHTDPVLEHVLLLLSARRREGYACLNLNSIAGAQITTVDPDSGQVRILEFPELARLVEILRASPAVGEPGETKPLVLDHAGRLYLLKFWNHEQTIIREVLARAAQNPAPATATVMDRIRHHFGMDSQGRTDPAQHRAALIAATRDLCIITGGPGTGKTFTLTRALAVVAETATPRKVQIAVAAPTGKAAARIQELITASDLRLANGGTLAEHLAQPPTTLHRLLGASQDGTRVRFSRDNPLPYDVVAVDEASMVDLAMMARLLDALPPRAKLILCGDRNQLASVEPGAVFGDLCAGLALPHAARLSPLAECITELRTNFRFGNDSRIHQFGTAVAAGDPDTALAILERATEPGADLVWRPLPGPAEFTRAIAEAAVTGFSRFMSALAEPAAALAAANYFRVLCAVRDGPFGVNNLNSAIEVALERAFRLRRDSPWYHGRLIMITKNDHALRLFNGDTGVVLAGTDSSPTVTGTRAETEPESDGAWSVGTRAVFAGAEGRLRVFHPVRLPAHETAFAITVHKSQGSEFDHVLVVLPPPPAPILTRELLYTAVTRARKSVEIWASEESIRAAVATPITRDSGMAAAFWPGCSRS